MSGGSALDRGRASFERKAWGAAFAELTAADQDEPLEPEDLERLSIAATLIGKDDDAVAILTRCHHEHLRRGNPARAARLAFWCAMSLFNRGEEAQGGGWLARTQRILDEAGIDCVERAYPLIPLALMFEAQRDFQSAFEACEQAGKAGERFQDPDLMTLSRLGQGSSLVELGQTVQGMSILDEVMVTVTTDEVNPIVVGIVYCAVIDVCHRVFDVRRAQEWTGALDRWCQSQPDLAPYRGQCLVHRATLKQLHGSWEEAVAEAERACERLSQPNGHHAIGSAYYRRAELRRLRGEFEAAEASYRLASERGASPQPGLALLRLAQGNLPSAVAAIRRELDEAKDPPTRAALLPAQVEIALASGDVATARTAAEELARIASELDAAILHAEADHAAGAVLLAEGNPRDALEHLREALARWRDVEAPYGVARTRVLIGLACLQVGDEDSCRMEVEAARRALEELGAAPDLAGLERRFPQDPARGSGGLTGREIEILRLVAAGKSNRAIASELVISEKTVARHVSNIFTKLELSSRAAATAYAYQHGLV